LEFNDTIMVLWNEAYYSKAAIKSVLSVYYNSSTQYILDHKAYNK